MKIKLQLFKKQESAPITETNIANKIKMLAAAGTWKNLWSIKKAINIIKIKASKTVIIAEK